MIKQTPQSILHQKYFKKLFITLGIFMMLFALCPTPGFAVSSAKDNNTTSLQKQITGRVVDQNGLALSGAVVLEKGTTNGSLASEDGSYSIKLTTANPVLVFSMVGYATQEITSRVAECY